MFFNVSRVAAVLVAGGYLLIAILSGGMVTALTLLIYLMLPLACIMVPEAVATLNTWHPFDWDECPEILIVLGGWALLLMPLWTPWLATIITGAP